MLRETMTDIFARLWAEDRTDPPPVLEDDTVLLETGIDSMGFAVYVAQLDEELGFDPFTSNEDAVYPRTFGEFVRFYEANAPK